MNVGRAIRAVTWYFFIKGNGVTNKLENRAEFTLALSPIVPAWLTVDNIVASATCECGCAA